LDSSLPKEVWININIIDIVVDTAKYQSPKNIGSTLSLKRASNTFNKLFEKAKKKLTSDNKALKFVLKPKPFEERMIMRYVSILAKTGVSDPFLELFGFIRQNIFLK